jgi:hypothetical protein
VSPENGTRRRRSKTPEMDPDLKRELKKTRQCLKQTEAKVKAMEEEIQVQMFVIRGGKNSDKIFSTGILKNF